MTSRSIVADAFEAFIVDTEATLAPSGFLAWVRQNRPELLENVSVAEIVDFAGEYCGRGLRTSTEVPPLLPKGRRVP